MIIDLEDAVSPEYKTVARAAVANWLSPKNPVLVRINSVGTDWFRDDVELCRIPGVAGIVLPKAERVEDIQFLAERTGIGVLLLIETTQGFWNAHSLAHLPAVQRLLFGTIDFQVDLGSIMDEEELLYFRLQLVLISRLAGLQAPVDGVSTAIDDPQRLRIDTLRAKRLGFGGKLCIHPKQVGPVNDYFSPSPEDITWAQRVLEATAASGGSAVAVDGKMVDRPVILKAERILSEAQRR